MPRMIACLTCEGCTGKKGTFCAAMCGEPLVADSNEDVGRWPTDGRQHKVVFVNALVSGDCREQNHLYGSQIRTCGRLRCKLSAHCEENMFHACRACVRSVQLWLYTQQDVLLSLLNL